ncbi:hypothetical protein A3Q56_06994, partial [Intoshia linei]
MQNLVSFFEYLNDGCKEKYEMYIKMNKCYEKQLCVHLQNTVETENYFIYCIENCSTKKKPFGHSFMKNKIHAVLKFDENNTDICKKLSTFNQKMFSMYNEIITLIYNWSGRKSQRRLEQIQSLLDEISAIDEAFLEPYSTIITKLEGDDRKKKLETLKNQLKNQQTLFKNIFNLGQAQTKASYMIAYLLGKKRRAFSDAEMVKEAIIETLKCVEPDNISKYENIPLSRKSDSIYFLIQQQTLAIDESTDATDSAQLLIFSRVIDQNFSLFEELLVNELFVQYDLKKENMISICTDGAPAMLGKNSGFLAHLRKNFSPHTIYSFHCILHQQSLCAKSVLLDDTFQKINSIVIFIRSNSTRHRQFRTMLQNEEFQEKNDIIYHSCVRWLSQAKILKRVFELKQPIINFFETLEKE